MSLNLITDRTDVDYQAWLKLSKIPWASMTADQQATWSVPMKGAYNYTDLNRVGLAITYLQSLLSGSGYNVTVSARTDWAIGEWPSETTMTAYLQSISNLRAVLGTLDTTPPVPSSMDDGTVIIWNNIEQILTDVEKIINYMLSSYWYSGEIGCGEV